MSGIRSRQYRDGQRAMSLLPPCHCGAGWREENGRTIITGHSMECQQLKALGIMSRTRCTGCGRRLIVAKSSHLTKAWCRFGHCYSMSSGID